ncbi:Uncharacterized protein ALO94_04145 [Pseudomonas syringae pv. spinaceae]|uniref:KTSC domain-containing protein n=1 Tax=Pseudomonas syringae pv. spinaceae TaxID=264459 RepID=A0A0Q0A0G8_PSESX|nr:hypothetical protein [Pseudomonas syringae]KPY56750.1 Uncharacterized protein ALO94_04145 [Pseudomonas syringae pv. spinaceae]
MERYGNLGGNSNVARYEISADSIIVEFGDGSQYLYDGTRPGQESVADLQRFARAGQGLNSYISRVVRKNYARKLR